MFDSISNNDEDGSTRNWDIVSGSGMLNERSNVKWWVKIEVKIIIVSVQVKCGCDWCCGNDGRNLGTVVGTCEPGSGYDLKVKWDVCIISDNLDYWYGIMTWKLFSIN